jgi:hypothetical protein
MLANRLDRQASAGPLPASATLAVAILAIAILAAAVPRMTVAASPIVPKVGTYKATGAGDPANYLVQAQVKRKGGRKVISAQVKDSCGGFATFVQAPIGRASNGTPTFSARVGAASIGGRWGSSTRIKGTVKTPCAARQEFVMHLVG